MVYLWVKTLHIVFVMSWMAAVFYLPRILINIAETPGKQDVHAQLFLMGRRLYRFGHIIFGIGIAFGLWLWLVGIGGAWLHAKLGLVALLLAYFIWSGRLLKGAEAGKPLPSGKSLRLLNEIPLVALIGVVYLVVAKPF